MTLLTEERIRQLASRPKAILVDIDGTIADITHRAHHVNNPSEQKNWPAFNATMHKDLPKQDVIAVIKAMANHGYPIILVTGRFEEFREVTTAWLLKHGIPYSKLIMRQNGDYRSDHIIKRRIYHEQIYGSYDIIGVFDDRDSVVQMWREQGLTCFQVQKGDY